MNILDNPSALLKVNVNINRTSELHTGIPEQIAADQLINKS